MSRTQQQLLQQYQQQSRHDGGQANPNMQAHIPSTVHSCENPFRFIPRNFQEFGESFDEKADDGNRNQLSSSDEDNISQRKLLLQKLKKLESRKQQNSNNYKNDNSSWSNEFNSNGHLKQVIIPPNQKGSCFTFNDDACSQKVLTEQSVAGHYQQQPIQQQISHTQSSTNHNNDSSALAIQILKAELTAVKKDLENSEHANLKLKKELKEKIQQIEDLQKEFEKVNSQFQQQQNLLKGQRDNGSRSKDTLRNSQNSNAIQEQKKFVDELISTNYIKDNQINHLMRELKNSYLIINKQKEEIQKLTTISSTNIKSYDNENADVADQLKQLKTIQTTYQTIAYTEPDLRNDELSYVKENEYLDHIQKLQKKIDILQQKKSKLASEMEEVEGFSTKTNKDKLQIKFAQGDQIKSSLKKSGVLDQLPTSKSQNAKDTIDKKNVNFDRKELDYQLTIRGNNTLVAQNKQDNGNTQIPEAANFGQFSLLESELFNKNKDFGMNNLMEMESFNLSPIKNKSYKQEKSTICDKSCLQAILTIDDLSQRGIRVNPNTVNIQNSEEQVKEYENLQEELELNQNNFQNRIKKVLDMNSLQSQGNEQLLQQQIIKDKEQKSKEDTCPDFQEFLTQLQQNNIQQFGFHKQTNKLQNLEESNRYDPENKQVGTSKHKSRYDDYQQQDRIRTDSSGSKQYLSASRQAGIDQQKYQSQGLQKSQSHSVQAINQIDDNKPRKKDDTYTQRIHSVDNEKSKYQKLQIGIPNNLYHPVPQQQQLSQQQLNSQQKSELHYSMYYNNKTKSEAALNSHQRGESTHSKERKQQNSGHIIKQVPHTTKETSKRFIFDTSEECSMQFKEDIDDFRRLLEGKRRSSLNADQINNNKQDYSPILNVPSTPGQSNSNQNMMITKRSLNQCPTPQSSNMKNEQKSSSQSLGASNRVSYNTQHQPPSSKKKLNENNNLRYYENNNQSQQHNYDSQVRSSTGSISQFQNQNMQRNNRINSITENENKHFIGGTITNKKMNNTPTNNSCSVGNKTKIDSIHTNQTTDNPNRLTHQQNIYPFATSTPKASQEQVSQTSKKKLNNLANGNSYHLQQKHHDKYDFYYQNNPHTMFMMMNQNSIDDQSQGQKNNTNNYPFYNNAKNNVPSVNGYTNSTTVAPSHSSGELASQNKIISSNKPKKVTGMIVNTATSRDFECMPTATSSLLRKQIASTVNEAVRNSTQHLQIIYNSNNLNNNQSNQQLSQQQQSTTRQGENHSIDSSSSRKQEKNYISQNNHESNIAQQSYHGLQNILNQHVNKYNDNGLNSRYVSSNVERLREVKNKVRDLNLNNESNSSQSLHVGQKENYPPASSGINIINSIFQSSNSNQDPSSVHSKNAIIKGGDKSIENQSNYSRRSSQNNQFSNVNKSGGQYMSNNIFKNETEYSNDKLSNLLKDSNKRNFNGLKNDESGSLGFKRNSSYNNQSAKQSSLILESNSIRKSDSVKRSQK